MREIRAMREDDLAGADGLLRAAFGVPRSFVGRLRRYRWLEPDGWFVGEEDGALVGTVGVVRYEGFACVGLMAVAPGQQRRGLGQWLMEHALAWLEARGVSCAVLDATPAGAPLYQRLGFVEVGTSVELAVREPGEGGLRASVARAHDLADRAAVVSLDAALFGAERSALWARLESELPGRTLLARDARGQAVGYLLPQPGQLGPWGARDPDVAAALLAHALAGAAPHEPLRVQVPAENVHARGLLEAAGFVEQRRVSHMRRGDLARAPRWTHVYGKGSYCLG